MIEWIGVGAVVALAALWAVIYWAKGVGQDEAELESARRAAENRRTRNDADRNARDDDDPNGSLRDEWGRD